MKKVFLLLCLMATTTIVTATDLWEGTHEVGWSNTLTIEAAKFSEAQIGQKIVIEFTDATGKVIELHSNGGMLPGTRYAHFLYADQHEMEVFITTGMLACLKEHGMEICGKGFTATKVWFGDGKDNVDENTVWTGYFWMDEWSTLGWPRPRLMVSTGMTTRLSVSIQRLTERIMSSMCSPDGMKAVSWATRPR